MSLFRQLSIKKYHRLVAALALAILAAIVTLTLQNGHAALLASDEVLAPSNRQAVKTKEFPEIPEDTSLQFFEQTSSGHHKTKLTQNMKTPELMDEQGPTPTPSELAAPDMALTYVQRLSEYPRVAELTDFSNIRIIQGEYCVAGDLLVICYNPKEDTFNTWNDIDPTPFFGPEVVLETSIAEGLED
jgi:hypothetical protein